MHINVIDFCASLLYNTLVFLYDRVKFGTSSSSKKKGSFISNGNYTVGWKSSKEKYRFCAVWDILGKQKG